MERRDDNDLGAVAMPGFIDILSTVIIMFVFFVTVIAVMLYVHTVKFKAEVVAESKQQISAELKEYVKKIESGEIKPDDLKAVLDLAEKKNEMQQEMDKLTDDIKQIKTQYADSRPDQKTQEIIEDKSLLIFFDKNAITTAQGVEVKISEFLKKIMSAPDWKNKHYKLTAGTNPAAPTVGVARELSLARMLNVRNNLLRLDIPHSAISLSYSDEVVVGGDYNWVKIVVEK